MYGSSFSDASRLKKDNIKAGFLYFLRKKTGTEVCVKLQRQISEVLELFHSETSGYLLPVLRKVEGCGDPYLVWRASQTALSRLNRHLKKIGEIAGLPIPLTSYVARHTWATQASQTGMPAPMISQALGHESERMAAVYVRRKDPAEIGKAGRRLLKQYEEISLPEINLPSPDPAWTAAGK